MKEPVDERYLGEKLFTVYRSLRPGEEYALVVENGVPPIMAYAILLRIVAEGTEELDRILRGVGQALEKAELEGGETGAAEGS